MFESYREDGAVFKRIARRVEHILDEARQRESKGQRLALEIDAKFELQDAGAVQFQLATAILEEMGGLNAEEVVSELLALGLAAVLEGAAEAVGETSLEDDLDMPETGAAEKPERLERSRVEGLLESSRLGPPYHSRTVN